MTKIAFPCLLGFAPHLACWVTAGRLTPEGLTALTLLLAESAPSNKDLMIRLIINLLVGSEL
jgi:hypothetical protein